MKLKRLKLDDVRANYKPLSEKQQAEIVGGFTQSEFLYMKNNGAWQGGEVYGMGYVTREGNVSLDGITVYGNAPVGPQNECPQCQQWLESRDLYERTGGLHITPIGTYFLNTLPHSQGWGNHK